MPAQQHVAALAAGHRILNRAAKKPFGPVPTAQAVPVAPAAQEIFAGAAIDEITSPTGPEVVARPSVPWSAS